MENRLEKKHYYFLICIFLFYGLWAMLQPVNAGPDESMRYSICQYILNHGSLPHGADPEIMNWTWGQSYAFTPILAYMLCAIPMKIVSLFTSNAHYLWLGARMMNVVLAVGTIYLTIKIGRILFKEERWQWLFIIFVGCLPQFAFIFTYVNNDGLALFSCAFIVYAWLSGFKDQWSYRSCTLLAVGLAVCALSYYNAYGFILVSIFIFIGSMIHFHPKQWFKPLMIKGLYISALALLLAGWWFIRNYLLYDGDFIGMSTSNYYAELYAADQFKPSLIASPSNLNMSLWEMLISKQWLLIFLTSFIARFGGMMIFPPLWFYPIWGIVICVGMIGCFYKIKEILFSKEFMKDLFNWGMLIALIIPNLLNLYYSYFNDFQPQGRYSMPMIIPLAYFIVLGTQYLLERFKWKKHYVIIMSSTCIFTLIYSLFFIIIPYYY